MGIDSPRLAVQVKSGSSSVSSPDVRNLRGAIDRSSAELGLFVAWGGFSSSVDREAAGSFFQIRRWNADKLVEELLDVYENLSDNLNTEIPLKCIWTLVEEEFESTVE